MLKDLSLVILSFFVVNISFVHSMDYGSSTSTQVGVYYFGGWQHFPNLRLKGNSILMDSFPNRRPLKGWFDDQKDVMDSEIRDAVKHNISFFAFLWYYPEALSPERIKLNEPLKLFLKSEIPERKSLRFCLVYTNHNHATGFGITSISDWQHYTDLWIEMMKRRDYYRVSLYSTDTLKPLFIIWSPSDFHEQWLSSPGGPKGIIEGFRHKALANGLPGINIAGCWDQTTSKDIFTSDGYDIVTGYSFYNASNTKAGEPGYYNSLAVRHKPIWDSMATLRKPVIPVVTSGSDPRPWPITFKGRPYYPDRTPLKFKYFCNLAKNWVDKHEGDMVFPKTVLIYAWNELGEGGYILPTVGDGYAYLEAIKEVFGKNISSRK